MACRLPIMQTNAGILLNGTLGKLSVKFAMKSNNEEMYL